MQGMSTILIDQYPLLKNTGDKIRRLREQRNLTQTELARYSGIHQSDISKIEAGRRRLGMKCARKLSKALDCSYVDFLEPDEYFA